MESSKDIYTETETLKITLSINVFLVIIRKGVLKTRILLQSLKSFQNATNLGVSL